MIITSGVSSVMAPVFGSLAQNEMPVTMRANGVRIVSVIKAELMQLYRRAKHSENCPV